jgi:hypothetical protein
MSDFVKITSIVTDLARRVRELHAVAWVHCTCSASQGGWYASSHMLNITTATYSDPFSALEELEQHIRFREDADANLAKTLGLEAAE